MNINVYILKHFFKLQETSLDISRRKNCWNGNFVLRYSVVILTGFYVPVCVLFVYLILKQKN